MNNMFSFLFKKEVKKTGSTEFSRFFRDASSAERKKVFKKAARKANEDQRKIFYPQQTKHS